MPRTPRTVPSRRSRTPRRGGALDEKEDLAALLEAAVDELDQATDANRLSNTAPGYVNDAALAVVKASFEGIRARYDAKLMREKNATLSNEATQYAREEVDKHPLKPVLVNPGSRFVVATYWWGKDNFNKNTGWPCPDVTINQIRSDLEAELYDKDYVYTAFVNDKWQPALDKVEAADGTWLSPTKEVLDAWLKVKATRIAYLNRFYAKPETQARMKAMVEEYNKRPPSTDPNPRKQGTGGLSKQPIKMQEMIAQWTDNCRKMNCNYLVVEYPAFAKVGKYQSAINAKPMFIEKALQSCEGRGVLYIDGDMFVRQYPKIFDMLNVDFMAHGWNCDPRSNIAFKEWQCFDPYIFETSGGTMFFADTPAAHKLLTVWETESHKPENYGKADDRILSMVFTKYNMVLETNIIQLPMEYLWLTNKYAPFDFQGAADVKDAVIEHPACLTAEEAAADQGAANDRYPATYHDDITNRLNCDRPGGVFYEVIAFQSPNAVDAFGPYLKWMSTTTNTQTGKPMFTVIPFAKAYGAWNPNVIKNHIAVAAIMKDRKTPATKDTVTLPLGTPVPEILYYLVNDVSVNVGAPPAGAPLPGIEIVATNRAARMKENYLAEIWIDTQQPIFFSHKSRTLRLMLQMCETLEDINTHLRESYVFLSRIRWSLIQQGPSKKKVNPFEMEDHPVLPPVVLSAKQVETKERQARETSLVAEAEKRKNVIGAIPKMVHQIWMGTSDPPPWRMYLFALNKEVAERNGYTYELWMNVDRTKDNFPSTIAYQDMVIDIGKKTGQSRWAQVADLARMEIIYKHGGIYIDSLFETGDEFYQAITALSENDYKFVGCNEDPCRLECKGANDQLYLTNSFFAASQWSPVMERLLDDTRLGDIDYESQYVNRTTGPYYLRTGILDEKADGVFLLDTEEMFPFNVNASDYREVHPNTCLSPTEVPDSIQAKPGVWLKKNCLAPTRATATAAGQKPPLAIYHSGLGGTWSF